MGANTMDIVDSVMKVENEDRIHCIT